LQAQLEQWLAAGSIDGVYWLPALDFGGAVADIDLAAWRAAMEQRVKLLYVVMRTLYQEIAPAGTFLVAATRLGGMHGYDAAGAIAPMGGAVSGFTKAYARERAEALVKVVDFAASRKTAALADILLDETLRDPGAVEIGVVDGRRWSITVTEQAASEGEAAIALNSDTVFAITGAAGSIVSAITADLAAASGGTFYLLDMAPAPDPDNADIRRVVEDRDGLKRELFERLKAAGERATPAIVERQLAGLERLNSALTAIDAVRAAGGEAHYLQLDLTDADAVAAAVETIRSQQGRIDVLLHAAGIERSHTLPDKPPEEFDLVFDVKCDGWFNLLHAIGDMPLAATVVFSSIAGRFGNMGQTDYSAANDLLCKYTSAMRSSHPQTRAIAIDWTAWASIGMASRGSIPEMMAQAGIDMLAPEAGIPVIRRELTEANGRGELVIADRLGVLMQERDPSGGLDIAAATELIAQPMLGQIIGMGLYQGLRVDTRLDPAEQPFLFDHQIEATPVLPGVMALEAFAELAQLLFPEMTIRSLEDIEFMAPMKFYRHEPHTLELSARFGMEGDELVVHCQCASSRLLHGRDQAQSTTHFTASIRMGADSLPATTVLLPEAEAELAVTAKDLYRIYFHGPAYQVLERAWLAGDKIVARMAENLPLNHMPEGSPLVLHPRLIELCFQAAGAWQIGTTGKMALPRRIAQIRLPGGTSEPAEGSIHALVSPQSEDTFDAEVIDGSGRLLLRLEGYQSIEYPSPIEESLRLPLYAALSREGQTLV
jgi:NAD(P)-dependent dehydrogenase (short-subunit alcohol dehydrogenase family)